MPIQVKGFGWKRDFNDPRDFTPEQEQVKKILTQNSTKKIKKLSVSDFPKAVDNRKFCTPIENQGELGSCTANAGVGMYEYMENKANGKYIDGSRLFLYKATRLLMGEEGKGDSGAYIRTTLGAIRLFGIPNEQFWPYTDDLAKFDIMPDSWLWAFAQSFQSLKHFRLDYSSDGKENVQRMKEYVTKGYALDFGFMVFSSYKDAANNKGILPYPSAGESIVGGHSVLIVGYDDNRVSKNPRDGNSKTGCFLIRNSWGESWGDHGYGWIPYEYFIPKANGDVLADDVWTITQQEWVDTGEFFFR
jgi:C1A family cysteine protease